MKITLICNCGLLFQSGQDAILIDGINRESLDFKVLPDAEYQKMLTGQPPYEVLPELFFSHRHSDHMDRKKVRALLEARGTSQIAAPAEGTRQAGCFTVTSVPFAHTPIPTGGEKAHYVLLVEAEGKLVYVAADADIDAEKHRRILNGRVADAAFWNGQYLSYPETRKLLRESAKKNYIYHNPEGEDSGIVRKCLRNLERYPDETQTCTVLNQYPTVIEV